MLCWSIFQNIIIYLISANVTIIKTYKFYRPTSLLSRLPIICFRVTDVSIDAGCFLLVKLMNVFVIKRLSISANLTALSGLCTCYVISCDLVNTARSKIVYVILVSELRSVS